MALKTVRARIQGRVQGVWYRGWTVDTAKSLGLDGWVRNRFDGSVEAVFAGDGEDVTAMLERCWSGPPAARVDNVEVTNEVEQPPPGFTHLPTA